MSVTKHGDWLTQLPQVKNSIKVLLDSNREYSVPNGRIRREDKKIIIEPVLEERPGEFLRLGTAFSFPLSELVRIKFEDDDGSYSYFGPSLHWLKDLPKSRENIISMICTHGDQALNVEKGWIEYDELKIYIREIIGKNKRGYILKNHERILDEVLVILVNRRMTEPMLFMRSTAKMPS
ncbi:hypothetical protein KGO95_02880 [Patescibacteria group bacterium]|nr:hypothetical protein [Patescibacteria group bacterium]